MTWKTLAKTFQIIILATSPDFRKLIEESIRVLYAKALETSNPWDDWFIKFLAKLLIIDLNREAT